jgi:hypothetical protein
MQRVLHGRKHLEHGTRREFRLDQAGSIEKRSLPGWTADGTCFPVSAHGLQRHSRHEAEQLQGPVQLLAAPAQIRTAPDEASCHVEFP